MNWRGLGMLVVSASLLRADGPPVTIVGPDSAPTPVPAAPTPPPAGAPSIAIVAPQAAPLPPGTKPVQLQFIAQDTVQEDLVGKVKSVYENPGDFNTRTVNFDLNGCYTDETHNRTGVIKEHRVWVHDAQGNLVSIQIEVDPNIAGTVGTNTYDAAHRKVTTVYKLPDGTIKKTRVTFYDRFQKEHEVYELDGLNNVTDHSILNRDANGHETSVIFYDAATKQPKSTIAITWNPDGTQATESMTFEDVGNSVDSTYKYLARDEQGNWTRRVRHFVMQKNLQTIREGDEETDRTISYY